MAIITEMWIQPFVIAFIIILIFTAIAISKEK